MGFWLRRGIGRIFNAECGWNKKDTKNKCDSRVFSFASDCMIPEFRQLGMCMSMNKDYATGFQY